jgi:hypothetical protein
MKIIKILLNIKRKYYLFTIISSLILFLIGIFMFFSQKLPIRDQNTRVLQFIEHQMQAQNDVNRQFHVLAAANLEVPGYIIGLEKAKKDIIGFSKINLRSSKNLNDYNVSLWKGCNPSKYLLYDDSKSQKQKSIIGISHSQEIEQYKKVNYVSQINKFSYLNPDDPKSNIVSESIYNSYECRSASNDKICNHLSSRKKEYPCRGLADSKYNSGWQSLLDLKSNINKDLKDAKKRSKPYTHLIIYSMGWNTTQREAIQDFNFLEGNLIRLAKKDKELQNFNPLMIGITWPSDWAMEKGEGGVLDRIIRPVRRMSSFFVKRNDADEIGDIFINILLRDVLLTINDRNKDLKLVLIGHSFGARVLTSAIFADPLSSNKKQKHEKIDLLIGLQGAFPVTRFVKDEGLRKHPYFDFNKRIKRVVFTSSAYDKAVTVIEPFTNYKRHYIGSKNAHDYIAKKYPEIFENTIVDSCGNFVNNGLFAKSDFEKECFSKEYKKPIDKNLHKIVYVDASKLINHLPKEGAGGAHGDIFHDGVTNFILNNIKMIGDNKTQDNDNLGIY